MQARPNQGGNSRPLQGGESERASGGLPPSKKLTPIFNRAASGTDPAAIPPQPKLNREPPKKAPEYPSPEPGGLSAKAKAEIISERQESLRKKTQEQKRSQSLTREFNERAR